MKLWYEFKLRGLLVVVVAAIWLLAACAGPSAPTSLETADDTRATSETPAAAMPDTEQSEAAPAGQDTPNQAEGEGGVVTPTKPPLTEVPPNPAPTQVAFVPSERTGFTPTDPSSVVLASGQVQFIEFFAFW